MAGWEIAVSIVAGWFAVSLPVAVVIGKALRYTSAPADSRSAESARSITPELISNGRPTVGDFSRGGHGYAARMYYGVIQSGAEYNPKPAARRSTREGSAAVATIPRANEPSGSRQVADT